MPKFLALLFILITGVSIAEGIYKWVDEHGITNYSQINPAGKNAQQVKLPPQPAKDEEAELLKQKVLQQQNISLSLDDLGPLPKNESSKYVETAGTGVFFDSRTLTSGFQISLLAKYSLPYGAFLEAKFEDPENPNNKIVVGQERRGDEQTISIMSPQLKGLKCRNYQVTVDIYADKSKGRFLGSHYQRIQSKINLDKIKTPDLLNQIMNIGNCP